MLPKYSVGQRVRERGSDVVWRIDTVSPNHGESTRYYGSAPGYGSFAAYEDDLRPTADPIWNWGARRLYVASSWKNEHYSPLLERLKTAGYLPLDWRDGGFGWRQTGSSQETMTAHQYRDEILKHPRACEGFESDFSKMREADACVLLLPCGRSAHLEAGWFWGRKPLHIFIPVFDTPELMYKGATSISFTVEELLAELGTLKL